MRIAINIPAVRSLSPNERTVHKLLGEGLTPKEISRKMGLPLGMNSFTDNYHDIPLETIAKLITSIREKGWEIPTDKYKEEFKMKKLTEADKRNIVTARQAGAKVTDLAEKYGVDKSTIYSILRAWNENGESAFAEAAADEDINAEEIACELHGIPPVSVDCDTDIEAYNQSWEDYSRATEKEPASAATDTSSNVENIDTVSTSIVPENTENVKSFEGNSYPAPKRVPEIVKEACREKLQELYDKISQEEQYLRTLYEDLQELNLYIEEFRGDRDEV